MSCNHKMEKPNEWNCPILNSPPTPTITFPRVLKLVGLWVGTKGTMGDRGRWRTARSEASDCEQFAWPVQRQVRFKFPLICARKLTRIQQCWLEKWPVLWGLFPNPIWKKAKERREDHWRGRWSRWTAMKTLKGLRTSVWASVNQQPYFLLL